jgi:hypothetical protein
MAFRHGKNAAVTVNSVALSSFCDSVDLSRDVDTSETTVFGNDDKTFIPGLRGGNINLSGNYDPTASTGPADVLEGLLGSAPFPVVYEPGGNVAGQRRHSFNAIITNYSENSAVGDKVTFSASMIITGAVTSTTI